MRMPTQTTASITFSPMSVSTDKKYWTEIPRAPEREQVKITMLTLVETPRQRLLELAARSLLRHVSRTTENRRSRGTRLQWSPSRTEALPTRTSPSRRVWPRSPPRRCSYHSIAPHPRCHLRRLGTRPSSAGSIPSDPKACQAVGSCSCWFGQAMSTAK